MRQDDEQDGKSKQKWKMEINSWLGSRKTGEWVRESVATNSKRTFEKHTHAKDSTKQNPVIVKVQVEEIVYAHSGYRPKLEGEKETRKAFYYRGARVWRNAA